MEFLEKFEFATPNGPQQGTPIVASKNLLVGKNLLAEYSRGDSTFSWRPAFYGGERGFLREEWFEARERGNSAEWVEECFIPLSKGIEELLSNGIWNLSFE